MCVPIKNKILFFNSDGGIEKLGEGILILLYISLIRDNKMCVPIKNKILFFNSDGGIENYLMNP